MKLDRHLSIDTQGDLIILRLFPPLYDNFDDRICEEIERFFKKAKFETTRKRISSRGPISSHVLALIEEESMSLYDELS